MTKMTFGRYQIEITNEDKIFFPEIGITKGELVKYYQKIAETMLPHMRDRPVVLHRFPDGINGKSFYQREASDYFPDWIKRHTIEKKEGGRAQQVICNNKATLVYLAGQACLTPHIWCSRLPALEYPDRMIFDLDPTDNDFESVRFAATKLREFLEGELDLSVFMMITGSSGIHVVVPLDGHSAFDQVRSFARSVTDFLGKQHPDRITTEVRKDKRKKRLFLDTGRNAYGQSGVAPYAIRPQKNAPIATPLEWDELGDRGIHAQSFTIENIFRRLGQKDDPWKNIDHHGRSIKKPQERLRSILAEINE